jgi:DNA-binding XRE family transcriptional regulator
MITDPSPAIRLANSIIQSQPHIPLIDLFSGTLYRIDLCYNFQVGNHVSEFISQLFKLEYPHRKTKPYYPTNGVLYYSQKSSLTIYDKEEECKDLSACGLLRAEASWRDKYLIGNLVGKIIAKIGDFTLDTYKQLLNNELHKVGLCDTIFTDPTTALKVLTIRYGTEHGLRLFGYMYARQTMTRKQMIDNLQVSKQSVYRNNKEIVGAGLSMSLANNGEILPQLKIV